MIVDYFEYVKSNGDVHFFCFRPFFARFFQKINLAFWCYLINLPAVYSQRPTSSPAHLFAIRGRRERGPGTLHTRDQNLPK